MEAALAREFVVSFEDDYMKPCKDLGSVTLKENGPLPQPPKTLPTTRL